MSLLAELPERDATGPVAYIYGELKRLGGPRLVPSLYRHFGHRPRFLALLATLLLPRFEDGSIPRAVEVIRGQMQAEARALAAGMSAPPAPHPAIAPALERFGAVIPEMIVVGRMIEAALPGSATGG